MNVPSSQLQRHLPTFTRSLTPAPPLAPFFFRPSPWLTVKGNRRSRGEQSPFQELAKSLPFNARSKSSPLDDENGNKLPPFDEQGSYRRISCTIIPFKFWIK